MIVASIRLTCDRCETSIPDLPGDAGSARRHAHVLHGWRRVRGEYGLPIDVCGACHESWRRRQVAMRLAQQFGVEDDS